MFKNVKDFDFNFVSSNSVGNLYKASGWIGNEYYIASEIFNGFTKKEIVKILKNKLLNQANA